MAKGLGSIVLAGSKGFAENVVVKGKLLNVP